jgi:hypothetical protein
MTNEAHSDRIGETTGKTSIRDIIDGFENEKLGLTKTVISRSEEG